MLNTWTFGPMIVNVGVTVGFEQEACSQSRENILKTYVPPLLGCPEIPSPLTKGDYRARLGDFQRRGVSQRPISVRFAKRAA